MLLSFGYWNEADLSQVIDSKNYDFIIKELFEIRLCVYFPVCDFSLISFVYGFVLLWEMRMCSGFGLSSVCVDCNQVMATGVCPKAQFHFSDWFLFLYNESRDHSVQ